MGAYDSLKSLVRQLIKTNGQNEITGQILQNVLIAMIDDLGITIDQQPTNGSPNAVSSGGTFDAFQQLQVGAVYDISANHADTKYSDLAAALGANGANIPQSLQKGGMSVKFVQSSDNKYVQARCMAQNFTTDVTQWQGVDDEPTAGSKNLVQSDGIYINQLPQKIIQKQDFSLLSKNEDARFDIKFLKGQWYYIKNTSNVDVSCFLYRKNGNVYEEVQTIKSYIHPNEINKTLIFNDADAIGGYSSSGVYSLELTPLFNALDNIYANNIEEEIRDKKVFSLPTSFYEKGGISYGNDDSWYEHARCRHIIPMCFPFDTIIEARDGYVINCFYYNSNQVFQNETSWVTSCLIPKDTYFRFVIWKNDSAQEESIPELTSHIKYHNIENEFAIEAINGQSISIANYYFEKGSLNRGQNDTWLQQARCRSKGSFKFDCDVVIKPIDRYFGVEFIDDSGTFISGSDWTNYDYKVPANNRFRLLVSYYPENQQEAGIEWLMSGISFQCAKYNALIQSITPDTIWACREGSITEKVTPPNSKYGIIEAARSEYDRIRCTIRKSTDNQYVLIHDDIINNIARNIDGSEISTTIYSNDLSLAQMNEYDWGIKYGEQYRGMHVPMLEEFVQYASMLNIGVTLELNFEPTLADIESIMGICVKYGILKSMYLVIQGLPANVINYVVQNYPSVSFFICVTYSELQSRISELKGYLSRENNVCWVMAPWGDIPTIEQVTYVKQNGLLIGASNVFSFNDVITKIIGKGFDIVECANIYNIKSTMRDYVRKLVVV